MSQTIKTYKLTCSQCGSWYRSDKRRGEAIAKKIEQDPEFLSKYTCQNCRKGVAQQNNMPKPMPINDNVLISIKDGKDYLKQFIPTYCENYINRKIGGKNDETILEYHLKSKNRTMKNVLLIGDTGTGKTLLARWFAYKRKLPYYRVVMNAGTTVEDIVGQNVMQDDGKFKFVYQILVHMMQHGGIFVIDEINAGVKELLHILNSISDFERRISVTQNKGEVIEACDDFLLIATMNPPDEYDLQEMSKSLKSRFCTYFFNYNESIDRKVLGNDEKLLEFAKSIRHGKDKGQIRTPLSTRDLVQFQVLRKDLGLKVAKEMLINKFQNGEKNVVRDMIEVHLEKSKILKQDDQKEKK